MRVALTTEEMVRYGSIGLARCAEALEKRRVGAHGFDRNHERWQIDVEGVLAEAAAAKACGLEYQPQGSEGQLDNLIGDIAPGLQVRGTKYATGNLLIHDRDPDDHAFILVTGCYGIYDIRGWVFAREGKDKKFWKTHNGRGAYWIPQSDLRPFDTLEVPA